MSDTPSTPKTRPVPTLALRQQSRADGSPFLRGMTSETVVIEAGSELHLRRVDAETFALMIDPPVRGIPMKQVRRDVSLDGSAVRIVDQDPTQLHITQG